MLNVCYRVSERRVCQVLQCPRSSYLRKNTRDEQAALRIRIRDLAYARVSYGYRRIQVLLRREGWEVFIDFTGWRGWECVQRGIEGT
jgi:putative transposase